MKKTKNNSEHSRTIKGEFSVSGKREQRNTSKGRQVSIDSLAHVRSLLGDQSPRRSDLLIEYLHLLQDHYGYLSTDTLAALAEEMGMSQAEVYEVATFYAHFYVVKESEKPPPKVTVRVCDSVTCAMFGADKLRDQLVSKNYKNVRVVRAPCMGRCDTAPTVQIANRYVDDANVSSVTRVLSEQELSVIIPNFMDFGHYESKGGYKLLRDCYSGALNAESLIAEMEKSALRGLGGAGFPTGQKWRLVSGQENVVLAVNADEGEPGTFKDRFVLETNPHQFLEGMLVAAWAVDAKEIYIYLRDEYPASHEILTKELAIVSENGLNNGTKLFLRRGAGAYICGEESAMLESLEGRRGEPRHKPPFPSESGLFGRPTLVHNVETLYWVPEILTKGAIWFSQQGRRNSKGLRLFSVSGRVENPGVKMAPAGISTMELINDHCGGVKRGHRFTAFLPGGASGGILPSKYSDRPLDFGSLDELGCFVGSGALIILGHQDPIKEVVLNLMKFFEDESCGQCTPCRVGCEKAVKLMEEPVWDERILRQLSAAMADASICGLGQAAPNPILKALEFFPDELPI